MLMNIFTIRSSNCGITCLAVITLDSALKKDYNYYLKVFLKECKYIERKVVRHIHENSCDFSSSDESEEE